MKWRGILTIRDPDGKLREHWEEFEDGSAAAAWAGPAAVSGFAKREDNGSVRYYPAHMVMGAVIMELRAGG